MSKEYLSKEFTEIDVEQYSWCLYFFKISRRNTNPFKIHKVKFKEDSYLTDYAKRSLAAILKYQIEPISKVEDYNGENAKVSCDKISLESELIKDSWKMLVSAVVEAGNTEIDGNIMGYILEGNKVSDEEGEENKSIILVKKANPIANLNTKKAIVFAKNENEELDTLTDETYRLYLTTDFIVLKDNLYAFNYTFEKIFNLENTMQKIKTSAIESILSTGCFNNDDFQEYAKSYRSTRTFISLKQDRLERVSTSEGRQYIAKMFNIDLDADNKFTNLNKGKAEILIKYLCFKVVKDDQSKEILEGSNLSKINVE